MHRTARKLQRAARRELSRRGTTVTLHWRTLTDKPDGYNPKLKPVAGAGTIVEDGGEAGATTIRAFVHYVTPASTGFQRFQEVEKGDVILDIDAAVDLSGKHDLRFEIDGLHYVQKEHGRELSRSWDARIDGVAVLRTLLLRPQQ
jgi:hypothetical protein